MAKPATVIEIILDRLENLEERITKLEKAEKADEELEKRIGKLEEAAKEDEAFLKSRNIDYGGCF